MWRSLPRCRRPLPSCKPSTAPTPAPPTRPTPQNKSCPKKRPAAVHTAGRLFFRHTACLGSYLPALAAQYLAARCRSIKARGPAYIGARWCVCWAFWVCFARGGGTYFVPGTASGKWVLPAALVPGSGTCGLCAAARRRGRGCPRPGSADPPQPALGGAYLQNTTRAQLPRTI